MGASFSDGFLDLVQYFEIYYLPNYSLFLCGLSLGVSVVIIFMRGRGAAARKQIPFYLLQVVVITTFFLLITANPVISNEFKVAKIAGVTLETCADTDSVRGHHPQYYFENTCYEYYGRCDKVVDTFQDTQYKCYKRSGYEFLSKENCLELNSHMSRMSCVIEVSKIDSELRTCTSNVRQQHMESYQNEYKSKEFHEAVINCIY